MDSIRNLSRMPKRSPTAVILPCPPPLFNIVLNESISDASTSSSDEDEVEIYPKCLRSDEPFSSFSTKPQIPYGLVDNNYDSDAYRPFSSHVTETDLSQQLKTSNSNPYSSKTRKRPLNGISQTPINIYSNKGIAEDRPGSLSSIESKKVAKPLNIFSTSIQTDVNTTKSNDHPFSMSSKISKSVIGDLQRRTPSPVVFSNVLKRIDDEPVKSPDHFTLSNNSSIDNENVPKTRKRKYSIDSGVKRSIADSVEESFNRDQASPSVCDEQIVLSDSASAVSDSSKSQKLQPIRKNSGSFKDFPLSYNPTPLREVAITSPLAKNTIDPVTKDLVALAWKDRIWPAKAIASFCRVLCRCIPVVSNKPSTTILNSNWNEQSFKFIQPSYTSPALHNSSFFMLVIEECRASLSVDTSDVGESNTILEQKNSSIQVDVISLLSQSEKNGLPQPFCDNRCCTVNAYKVSLQPDSISSSDIMSGDVVLLSNPTWSRNIIGIIQGWDPDKDISYLGTSTGRNRSNSFTGSTAEAAEVLDTVTIFICVEEENVFIDEQGLRPLGGWAEPGMIYAGLSLTMHVLGNALTFIREAQALASLRNISKSLQNTVLSGKTSSTDYDRSQRIISAPIVSGTQARFTPSSSSQSEIAIKCPDLWKELVARYNSSQLQAIQSIYESSAKTDSTISLLQGPPGTGKTHTILGILAILLSGALIETKKSSSKVIAGSTLSSSAVIMENYHSNSTNSLKKVRVLVCAPSNTAVDELVYRIHKKGVLGTDGKRRNNLKIVRIGVPGGNKNSNNSNIRKHQDLITFNDELDSDILRVVESYSLDVLVDEKRKQQVSEYKNRPGGTERIWINSMDIRKTILDQADIVCCTLSGAGSQPIIEVVLRLTGFKFDAVIIDEAAQATEPSALIPLKYDPKTVVMVGDPCQLPAVVLSRNAREVNYQQSLFERLTIAGHPVLLLDTQYRMHPLIAEYSSLRFYGGKIITDENLIKSKSHNKQYHKFDSYKPFAFHDIRYGKQQFVGTSITNRDEAVYILDLVQDLTKKHSVDMGGVGIIAPYSAQRRLLKSMFREKLGIKCKVEISTVDGFQGREKDIIIFSCVRAPNGDSSNSSTVVSQSSGIGFLKERQRLNVAITRAKYAVWIVGCAETLSQDPEWNQLIKFCESRGSVVVLRSEGDSPRGKDTSKQLSDQYDRNRRFDNSISHRTHYGSNGRGGHRNYKPKKNYQPYRQHENHYQYEQPQYQSYYSQKPVQHNESYHYQSNYEVPPPPPPPPLHYSQYPNERPPDLVIPRYLHRR